MDSLETKIRAAHTLLRENRSLEAIEAYKAVLVQSARQPDCWFNLAFLLRQTGQYEGALNCYEKALEFGVAEPEAARVNRAVIYSDYLRRDDAAAAELNLALELNPAHLPALLNLARIREDNGRRDEAETLYRRALAVDARCFLALARLADLQPAASCDAALIARLNAAITLAGGSNADRADLGFALGRALDARGEYREAFAAYNAANRASLEVARPVLGRYDRAGHEQITDRLIATPLPAPVAIASGPAAARPIFICGMFRSGSTVAEQLVAGHPRVGAGGELEFLPVTVAGALQPFPESLGSVTAARLAELAHDYRSATARMFPDAAWITDKRPDNFMCIGLIKTLFPDALIVHTTRDPLDTCLSIYFLHLDSRKTYAVDLMDIGHYYREYRRLMSHWRSLYGDSIIDFDYDDLVREPQAASAALFARLGLEWDAKYLDFRNAPRAVRTASVWQVREPLYRRSSGRARHYATQLEPLRAYLADLLPSAAAP